jgi:hypothetical protein
MSNWTVETLSLPCFLARASRFSCRRPRAIIWDPLAIIFSAKARPMPLVAPTTKTVLYGKGILKVLVWPVCDVVLYNEIVLFLVNL